MRTKILLQRTNPTDGIPFYYLAVSSYSEIYCYSQTFSLISEGQYITLKGSKEETYNGTMYEVNLTEIG